MTDATERKELEEPDKIEELPDPPPLTAMMSMINFPLRRRFSRWLRLTEGVTEDRFLGTLEGPELDQLRTDAKGIVEDEEWSFVLRFKVVVFGVSLGLAGQAGLWKILAHSEMTRRFGIPSFINEVLWIVGLLVLVASTICYVIKGIRWSGAVYREFIHPLRVNFFAAPFIAAMLLLLATPQRFIIGNSESQSKNMTNQTQLAEENSLDHLYMKIVFFFVMTPLFVLELYLYGAWMYSRKRSLQSGNPAYQMAVIGNFIGANLAAQVGLEEIGILLFAVGTLYYLLVFISIYQAISRGHQGTPSQDSREAKTTKFQALDSSLHPILFLFVAPPSAAALAQTQLTPDKQMNFLAKSFNFISLFIFLSLVRHLLLFVKDTPFSLSYWAYTMSMASLASSFIVYATSTKSTVSLYIGIALAALASLLIIIVAVLTLHKVATGGLFPIDPVIAVSVISKGKDKKKEDMPKSNDETKNL